jgi:hypothetical protein
LEGSIDFELWLRYSVHYEFDYVAESLAAHRVWSGQMSQGKRRRYEAMFHIQEMFLRQHPGLVDPRDIAEAWAAKYLGRGRWRARERQRWAACKDFFAAIRNAPAHAAPYRCLAKLLFDFLPSRSLGRS